MSTNKTQLKPILVAEGVRKVYRSGADSVVALHGLDLVVPQGEFICRDGPVRLWQDDTPQLRVRPRRDRRRPRPVRERRRQIGTLRALGFPAQSVGRSFAIEAGYVALQGTVIGVLLALLTLYTIVARSDAMGDLEFAVPIAQLSILLAATVAASLLATVAPALSAARIRPAVALRMTD